MTEIIPFAVIVVLCVLLGFMEYQNRKERAKFLNALIAKNAQDMMGLENNDKVDPNKKSPAPDLIPSENLTDEQFQDMINQGI